MVRNPAPELDLTKGQPQSPQPTSMSSRPPPGLKPIRRNLTQFLRPLDEKWTPVQDMAWEQSPPFLEGEQHLGAQRKLAREHAAQLLHLTTNNNALKASVTTLTETIVAKDLLILKIQEKNRSLNIDQN